MKESLGYPGRILSDFLSEEKKLFHRRYLFALLLFAFLLRVPLLLYPEVIHNDGTEYIRQAIQILSGNWAGSRVPPFYGGLIALTHTFVQNFELAGIWVSVIFGSLIILPVFYLGRELFDERVGMISALFAAVHPFLNIYSGSVLTESTYYFFLATSVLFGWYAFQRGRMITLLLFGLSTSLAYLTRPEGIGFLLIFSVWVLIIHPSGEKRRWMKKAGIIFIAILSFLAFSSPYLIQLRKETGRWEISKITSVSIGSLSKQEELPSIETIKRAKGFTLSSLVKNPIPALGKVGVGLLDSLYRFQQAFNPVLFILAVLGWIFLFKKKKFDSQRGSFYVLAYLVFFFGFVLPFFWVTRRFTSQMIPISIPWAAFGFLGVTDWVRKRFAGKGGERGIPALLLILLLVALFVQGRVTHSREPRLIQREAGLWMKDHLPRGAIIMSSLPQEAFYADLPWVRIPQGSYEEILDSARSKGARYFVMDDKIEEDSPHFLGKVKEEDLIPLMDLKRKNRRMVIFEIIYDEKSNSVPSHR